MIRKIPELLLRCGGPEAVLPATQLFNEGWLLRLALDWFARTKTQGYPLSIQNGARWYSEALLYSRFLPRYRGDILSESWTHADGVIGHFRIGDEDGGAVLLDQKADQLIVVEAKLMSPLSKGTKFAPLFNQAARNVACIAEALARAQRRPEAMSAIGFYVVAPRSQLDSGIFSDLLQKESITRLVEERVASYRARSDGGEKEAWLAEWFLPMIERIVIDFLSWEAVAMAIADQDSEAGKAYSEFYLRCLRFNAPGRRVI